jgi:hypothetical protein
MIREIRKVEDQHLVITIPRDYIHKELEILVFPISEDIEEFPNAINPNTAQNLKKFKLLMEQAKRSNIKVEKGVDIDDLIDEMNNDLY